MPLLPGSPGHSSPTYTRNLPSSARSSPVCGLAKLARSSPVRRTVQPIPGQDQQQHLPDRCSNSQLERTRQLQPPLLTDRVPTFGHRPLATGPRGAWPSQAVRPLRSRLPGTVRPSSRPSHTNRHLLGHLPLWGRARVRRPRGATQPTNTSPSCRRSWT